MLSCTSTTAVHICQVVLVEELLGWCSACHEMDDKDHELSILQIVGENILHSCYHGIQNHCNFTHSLYMVIIKGRLICSVYWIIQ